MYEFAACGTFTGAYSIAVFQSYKYNIGCCHVTVYLDYVSLRNILRKLQNANHYSVMLTILCLNAVYAHVFCLTLVTALIVNFPGN
jgi:hypothetical protein